MTESTTGYGYDTAPIVNQPGYVAHGLPAWVNRGGLVESYAYDSAGRMARKKSFGLEFSFEWNEDGQVRKLVYPKTPQPNATSYDPGDPSWSTHHNMEVEYSFDEMGRQLTGTGTHRLNLAGGSLMSVGNVLGGVRNTTRRVR